MGLLSFFGSAQVNFKITRRKTFSTATTEMRMSTIVSAFGVGPAVHNLPKQKYCDAITNHSKPFRADSRSFLFRRDADF